MVTLAELDSGALVRLRDAILDRTPVSLGTRRTASPHEFYRYPARFAPSVAAAAIDAFSLRGDVVADYFVGGGTTLVEARLAGRIGVGSDINSLATFVTRVKTRTYSADDIASVSRWSASRSAGLPAVIDWAPGGLTLNQFRNFSDDDLAVHRAIVLSALADLGQIRSRRSRDLARCIVLRTAQWAFDMRSEVPSAGHLVEALAGTSAQMTQTAEQWTKRYRAADTAVNTSGLPHSLVVQQGLPGMAGHQAITHHPKPSLILMSPPYPGVYVNYHRWKLRGRLETPLPFFIAGQQDGRGLSHYTMAARSDRSLDTYFARLLAAFEDIAAVCSSQTWVVQVVGFNDVASQLPRYLRAMAQAGFDEYCFTQLGNAPDGRLWREVPGRRWWTRAGDRSGVAPETANEALLIHRLAKHSG